jgi:hypothetical protein
MRGFFNYSMEEMVYSVVTPSKYLERQCKGEIQLREFTTVSTTLISTLLFLALCPLFIFLLKCSFHFLCYSFPFRYVFCTVRRLYVLYSTLSVCSVQYAVSLLFASLCYFLITRPIFLIFVLCWFSYFLCLVSILCFLCPCNVLRIVSIFVQVYRPMPPCGHPITINKYVISYHIISYHIISYHIISYHITSYHIISYNIIYHINCFSLSMVTRLY